MYQIKNSKELANVIEYTNLNNTATEAEMKEFLERAKEFDFRAVVINPTFVPLAKEALKDTNIKVVTVIGFPLGFESTESKIGEAKAAIEDGADELDMVVNLSYVKDKKYDKIKEEVSKVKELLGDKILKVIIETQALEDSEKAEVSKAIEDAGADYIKTSTGFVTAPTIYETVNDINIVQRYAPSIKIKVSSGADTYKIANQILTAGADTIGTTNGYQIVKDYRNLRENTQVTPKPITFSDDE